MSCAGPGLGAAGGAGNAPCQGPQGICSQGWWVLVWQPLDDTGTHVSVTATPGRAAHSPSPSSRDGVRVPGCQPRVPSTLSPVGVTALGPSVAGSTPGLGKGSRVGAFCKHRFSKAQQGWEQGWEQSVRSHTHQGIPRALPRVSAHPCSAQPFQGPSTPTPGSGEQPPAP